MAEAIDFSGISMAKNVMAENIYGFNAL